MTKLKICGMKFFENILEVSALQPDYLGFIFYEKSARFFEDEIPNLPKSIQKVGVFVNDNFKNIISKIHKYQLNIVQLHGNETPDFCKDIQTFCKVIKVFSIDNTFDFYQLENYETVCDYFLFDTKGVLHGGNGYAFDWSILSKYKSQKPFFLSGGIDLENFNQLKKLNLPIFAIDINSKFELEPGLKDLEKIKTITQKLKQFNQ